MFHALPAMGMQGSQFKMDAASHSSAIALRLPLAHLNAAAARAPCTVLPVWGQAREVHQPVHHHLGTGWARAQGGHRALG